MRSDRRTFLKRAAMGTGAVVATRAAGGADSGAAADARAPAHGPRVNMCGYAAPRFDRVRVGFIGLGARGGGFRSRGIGAVERFTHLEGATVAALCDQYEERVTHSQQTLERAGRARARGYSGSKDAWKKLCEAPEIDLVYICTPWALHAPMAVFAMEHGKHVAVEVPAAKTVDECHQLVETSEHTRRHCALLENCCYDFFELQTLNMAQLGFFGEIIHGEGSYVHFNRPGYVDKDGYAEMWRLKEEMRNGNIYPTHGMGPICQLMNINRGDRFTHLVSMQSDDFFMRRELDALAAHDPFFKPFAGRSYRGSINTTAVRTARGRTILSQHDVAIPRPYSRVHLVAGTKASAMKWPLPPRIALADHPHRWLDDKEMKALEDRYTPDIVKRVGELAKKVGGHGGMDFIMDWRLVHCLRQGLPLDHDVYDAASWSCVAPLTEYSVAHGSVPIDIPDFTRGAWETNAPIDLGAGT